MVVMASAAAPAIAAGAIRSAQPNQYHLAVADHPAACGFRRGERPIVPRAARPYPDRQEPTLELGGPPMPDDRDDMTVYAGAVPSAAGSHW